MYLPIPSQKGCARAWIAAASALIAHGDEAYNVIIDVDNPAVHDDSDNEVISLVDGFLREHDVHPIITVANTIFPQALYDAYGSPMFYEVYFRDFEKLSATKGWGRYFERMARHVTHSGEAYSPLQELIGKIAEEPGGKRYTSAYELAVYDPLLDRRRFFGGQCLSFLSFKFDQQRRLMLTAMYRNHHYITRCLGNLIGLGRLQAFVAKEAGVELGSLTCVSTHAEIDAENWRKRRARALVKEAASILQQEQVDELTTVLVR